VKYSYAKIHYETQELDSVNKEIDEATGVSDFYDDAKGFLVGGSFRINQEFYVFGELEKLTSEVDLKEDGGKAEGDADLQGLELGLGYIYSINSNWDANFAASYREEDVKLDILSTPSRGESEAFSDEGDESGFVLKGGARGMVTSNLEVRAFLNYIDVDEVGDDTYVSFGGDFFVTPNISLGGDVAFGDTKILAGGKLYF